MGGEAGRSLNQFFIMSRFLEDLFGLKNKTAVVIGGTGVLCGEIAQGIARQVRDRDRGEKSR